jgi:hypothetical protein
MKWKFKCPECQEKFTSAIARPKACPNCAYIPDPDDDDRVCMPAIRTAVTKAADQVYRDMERGSEVRMQAAAELTGASPAELSSMKITNLNDRRDAEISAKEEVNDVTRHMDAMRARGLPTGFGAGIDMGAVQSGAVIVNGQMIGAGVAPNAGIRTSRTLQAAMNHEPATPVPLEMINPGYKPRV